MVLWAITFAKNLKLMARMQPLTYGQNTATFRVCLIVSCQCSLLILLKTSEKLLCFQGVKITWVKNGLTHTLLESYFMSFNFFESFNNDKLVYIYKYCNTEITTFNNGNIQFHDLEESKTRLGNTFHFKHCIPKDFTSDDVYTFWCGLCNEFCYRE